MDRASAQQQPAVVVPRRAMVLAAALIATFMAAVESSIVATLFQRFKNGATVAQLMPTDWAHESNDLAKKDIYQKLNLPNHTAPAGQCATGIAKTDVSTAYITGNVADVETQMLRAGIRLSNVINQMCAGTGCNAKP